MTKTRFFRFLTLLLFVIGLVCLLYPIISNIIYVSKQKRIINVYDEQVQEMPSERAESMLEEAREYNNNLSDPIVEDAADENSVSGNLAYSELLRVNGEQMGYIVIPKIDVDLPIYHYSSEDVLTIGIGHLENSSLPVGGESTHCVLTGHSGLLKAKLFTNLEKLELGDKFYIKTLDKVLAYEVDQILVVLPNDASELKIIEGRDLVTLITCTPYGVNSHRLLVRGSRVEYSGEIDDAILSEDDEATDSGNKSEVDFSKSERLENIWMYIALIILMSIIIIITFVFKKKRIRDTQKDGGSL